MHGIRIMASNLPAHANSQPHPSSSALQAHFCFNWGYYTLLAWLPSYFELALGMQVDKSSFLTLIPYVAMTCMTPFVGPIADGMVRGETYGGAARHTVICAYLCRY